MCDSMAFSKFFRQENVLGLVFPNRLDIVACMVELQTTSEVIADLGGDDAVTALTGSNRKAISMWRTTGRFPWRTQLPIVDALRARGKTAPASLWGMKAKTEAPAKKPSRRRASA